MTNPHGLEIEEIPDYGDHRAFYIRGMGIPYVKVIFHDDPTIITGAMFSFDALTVNVLIAALELARELAQHGPDWRPDEEGG